MMLLLILTSLVAAAAALPAPERCCTPDTWQATLSATAGRVRNHVPGREHRDTELYYDFAEQRSAYETFTEYGDGTVSSTRIINLHRERRGFLIRANECFRFPIEQMEKFCIPESAEYIRTVRWGAGAGSNMTVNLWSGEIKDGERPIGFYGAYWASSVCVPVSIGSGMEIINEREREYVAELEGLAVYDISTRISNPRAFVPPPSCQNAIEIGPRDERMNNYKSLNELLYQ